MIVIGIDPGTTGAVAFIHGDRAEVFDLPTVELPGKGSVRRRVHGPSLKALIRQQCPVGEPVLAVMEDLSAGGSKPNGERQSSAQTVGSQYRTRGTIECCIEMLGLDVHPVHALTWKRFFGVGKDKKGSMDVARELFPDLAHQLRRVNDHNRAEALLVARWGLRKLT